MPQKTQRLVNDFDRESKARKDPSSFAQRFYGVFAEYFDYAGAELFKLKEHTDVLKKSLGRDAVWNVVLDDADQMTWEHSTGGGRVWTYPVVVTGDGNACARVETLEELLYPVPASFTVGSSTSVANWTIWASGTPGTYNAIAYPERLTVTVSGSTEYLKRSRLTDVKFSGKHEVHLTGLDENHIEFEERIQVRDDGVYWTNNIFKSLTDVKYEGFDGTVTITLGQVTPSYTLDPFRLEVHPDVEGPLKLEQSTTNYAAQDYATLTYFTDMLKLGSQYRRGDPMSNTETGWEQLLLDSGSSGYTPVDIAISWDDGRIYVVDDTGKVHVYELGRTSFGVPSLQSTLTDEAYITVHPIKPHAVLGETMVMNTWFQHLRYPIVGVTIKRVDPSSNVEYLQANGTWAAGVYQWPGQGTAQSMPEATWTDIQFSSLFDEVGTFEFYCIAETTGGTSTSYTGAMVDAVDAEVSIDLSGTVPNPTGIYWSHTGDLVLTDAGNAYPFTPFKHLYLADTGNQRLFMREDYTAVVVTSTYTPDYMQIPTGLDEIGFRLGITRLEDESLSVYRRRLLYEVRNPSGPTESSFVEHTSQRVGEFDIPMFEISLTLAAGVPVAADPYIEITSTRMRLYDDYSSGVPEFDLDLTTEPSTNVHWFLKDIFTTINGSANFDITALYSAYTYFRSDHMKFGSTARRNDGYVVLKSRVNNLPHMNVNEIYSDAFDIFETSVASAALVLARGDYYLDGYNGIVHTYEPARGFMSYEYQEFPFTVYWQPIRAYPYNDDDKSYRLYDQQYGDDDGLVENTVLNSEGARIANEVLQVHPLGWGR